MGIFGGLFGKKPTEILPAAKPEEAVIVTLNGKDLPQEVYDKHDLSTLEDSLIEALSGSELAEFDGNEVGEDSVVLYLYGPDSEKLFARIEPILRDYPLCQSAQVVIRRGKPG